MCAICARARAPVLGLPLRHGLYAGELEPLAHGLLRGGRAEDSGWAHIHPRARLHQAAEAVLAASAGRRAVVVVVVVVVVVFRVPGRRDLDAVVFRVPGRRDAQHEWRALEGVHEDLIVRHDLRKAERHTNTHRHAHGTHTGTHTRHTATEGWVATEARGYD